MSEEATGEAAAASTSTESSEGTTSESPTTSAPPTTSEGPPVSEGTVEIGDTRYQFEVICQERGAGEVKVEGEGRDPVSGGVVKLFLLASLVDPYIGLRLEDGTLIEPSLALESPLDLYVQNDVIRASAIRFVRDLDLETGTATEVGFGELEIHCYDYSNELPTVDTAADERCQQAVSAVESSTAELDRVGRELAATTGVDAMRDLYHRHGDLTDAVVNDLEVVMDACLAVFSVDEIFAAASVQAAALEARNEIYTACRELLAADGFDC